MVRVRVRGLERVIPITVVRRDVGGPHVRIKGVNVSPESMSALAANHNAVVPLLATASPQAWWSGPLRRPVPGIVTSPYGPTRGYGGNVEMAHKGVDFAMQAGMPVVAMTAGVVVLARRMATYGNCVILDHGQTVHSTYMHMSALAVRAGDRVEAGQVVGTIGATGLATGPHLHFGTSIGTIAVDPLDMMARGLP
jgi:murein DD-endopeptidase MepM/ murein hydrolase activator NlpD